MKARLPQVLASAGLVVVLVVCAVMVGTIGSPAPDSIGYELRKYIIQFLLIVALGAVVAFIVDDAKRRAESAEEERRRQREAADRERQYAIDTVRALLDRLDATYRAVKRKRRLLRLVSVRELNKKNYVDAVSKLSEDKEDMERLWRDIEVLERWLPELIPVRSSVETMEDYLNTIEDEWEETAPVPDDEFEAEHLPALTGFHVKWSSRESNFSQFRDPYYEARSALIALLARRRTEVVPRDSR